MSHDYENSRLFNRRAVLLGCAKAGLFSVLAGRLYYLQVMQGNKYRTLAEENRINLRLIAPPRGQILDRHGTQLALNQQNYRLILQPDQVHHSAAARLLEGVEKYLQLSEADKKRVLKDIRSGGQNPIMVRDNLSWDQVATISLRSLELPGIDVEVGEARYYPYGDALSHVVGYVGPVSADGDGESKETELSIPGFRIGKSGVEKKYDRKLRGEAGTVQMEVNARGKVVRELAKNNPRNGEDLPLNIDMGLQEAVKKRIAAEKAASVVVMDVHSGAVLAMVSHPGFDPNMFCYGISRDDWKSLNADETAPLLNKSVSGLYAPGSTFKIVTALAAMDSGILEPADTVFCPGHYELGKHRFHCWKRGGHGTVAFKDALAMSCDTYFYDLGHRVGIDRIQAMAKRLGLGRKSGIDIPNERSGNVPNRAWRSSKGGQWQQGETLITAIGQGYLLTTPVQLAAMAACVANGGKAVTPRIAKTMGGEPAPEPVPVGIEKRHLAMVRDAMNAVVNDSSGTAHSSRITTAGMEMAGKTGTSQVRRITMVERAEGVIGNDELPWKERDHALFIGYAPVDKPKYSIAVVIEHGGSGGHTAAPIARDILAECQKREI